MPAEQELIVSHPDHAALQNSDLNPFLFADVGTELNGSTLTMLSVLARLGQDPWVQAARWSKLPKAMAIDRLVAAITDIPFSSGSAFETKTVAARLVMLLPAQQGLSGLKNTPFADKTAMRVFGTSRGADMPRWLPMALLVFSLLLGFGFNLIHASSGGAASPEISQTKAQTAAPAPLDEEH
ncbi:hypothetical protein [Acidisoma cladoniae]|jgi:hypothetical protein|uniref:hypothetical protein n=1 Tax=Acidisoma cladoniae TaxID=3040935 RepID=UPI00254AC109|nr:hypothetical protein [Acidisoma sp. PAMC 29798]